MANTTKKPKPENLQTSAARAALQRIKKNHGVSYTRAIERGVIMLETHLNAPQGRTI